MVNLTQNREKLLRSHRIRKPNLRVLKGTLNSRILQFDRSGARNATKTKQITIIVTRVQVINIGNAGYIRTYRDWETTETSKVGRKQGA